VTSPGFNAAFTIGGNGNTASAGPGLNLPGAPFAVAGAIGGSGKSVIQPTTGVKIK